MQNHDGWSAAARDNQGQGFHFGPFRLLGPQGPLLLREQEISLRPKVLEVLWYLACHAGKTVTKDALLSTVWPRTVVGEGALAVCIRELRQALRDDAQRPRYIQTVHRRGYRFIARPDLRALAQSEGVVIVGRELELQALQACFDRAAKGQRQLIFLTGEAGIGKTTLVDVFLQRLVSADSVRLARGQCVEQYAGGEPYLPLLEALQALHRLAQNKSVVKHMRRLAPNWLRQLPLASDSASQVPGRSSSLGVTPKRMRRELADLLVALSQAQPLVLVLEDLQWSDPSTVETLALLARRTEPARLLLIGTYRPVELIVREHPLRRVKQELLLHGHCHELVVGYLDRPAVGAFISRCAPSLASDETVRLIYQRTEGLPLFVVGIVDYLTKEMGIGNNSGNHLAHIIAALPAGLQQFIELQFEALNTIEQAILEAASVMGTEFDVAAIAAAIAADEAEVENQCELLARRGLFIAEARLASWPDGTITGRYTFRHVLYQEVFYKRIGQGRRLRLHRAIGARLAQGYGEHSREVALDLARHCLNCKDISGCIEYLLQAAETAALRNAHRETTQLMSQALSLLHDLPQSPGRDRQELALLIRQGPALSMLEGYAAIAVRQAYRRALALAEEVGEAAQQAGVLRGLWIAYVTSADYAQAQATGEQLLRLAKQIGHDGYRLEAYRALGGTLFYLADLATSRAYLEQGIALYDAQHHGHHAVLYGNDPGIACRYTVACTLWLLGDSAQALARAQESLRMAQAFAHPFSHVCALGYYAYLHQYRREPAAVQARAEQMLAYATEQGFSYWAAIATMLCGWALAHHDQAAGINRLREGLASHQATGALLLRPYFLALLADAYRLAGDSESGLRLLAEASALARRTGERWYVPELLRLQGELRLARSASQQPQAQRYFQLALAAARRQGAKAWELRAALSLAQLWGRQGKDEQAKRLLGPVYGGFSEGFDSVDLQEAAGLLGRSLAGP